MKLEVQKARAAAVAAELAIEAVVAARDLLAEDPSAWEVGDAAYWLCRAAQKACEGAADALDPEEALEDNSILYAFQQANDALEEACDQADELVSLAEELNHEIRR